MPDVEPFNEAWLGRLCGVPRAASRVGLSRCPGSFTCRVFTQLINKYRDVVSLWSKRQLRTVMCSKCHYSIPDTVSV